MRFVIGCLATLMTVTACAGGTPGRDAAGGGEGEQGGGSNRMPALSVDVVAVRTDTVIDAITATGEVEAVQSIQVRPEVSGRIVEIVVREGVQVTDSAPLIRIDDAELRAQVAQAEADRDLAIQSLHRTRDLLARNAAAPVDLELAEANARRTQAAFDLLSIRLDRTEVRAPFAGVVGRRLVSLGDYVTPSSPLMTLQTIDPQRTVFEIPERYAEDVRLGQRVSFRVASRPGRTFVGVIDFISPLVSSDSRAILVKATVPNRRRDLRPGMFLELRIATAVRPAALIIPEDALVPLEQEVFVWVVASGEAIRREVLLGVRTPGFVEIRSGLSLGEQVVVGGQLRLQPGAKVSATLIDRTPTRVSPGEGGSEPQE